MPNLIKELVKKMPGIRRVIEGRDRYIHMYSEQVLLNSQLSAILDATQHRCSQLESSICDCEKECSVLRQLNSSLDTQVLQLSGELLRLDDEVQRCNDNITQLENDRLSLLAKTSELEQDLEQKDAALQELNYMKRSNALISGEYWNDRYARGVNSGTGSYGRLAEFKSQVVNGLLEQANIESAIEIGCGDGNQLSLINYKSYVGVDVSPIIVERNKEKFKGFPNRTFFCSLTDREEYINRKFDLGVSMDVIFHLLEDDVFHAYIHDLFSLASRYVIIYSSNHEEYTRWPEYRHRNFTGYVSEHFPEWELVRYVPNKYPYIIGREEDTSAADFYIYVKR